jgi:hypothetical protein
MSEDREDKTIGGITWHVSEPDGGPDVGISVYLGKHERLYVGEISRALFDECNGSEHFDSDGGWFIVHYKSESKELIAKCGEPHIAQEFIEMIAMWRRANR